MGVVILLVWGVACPTPRMPCNEDADCDGLRHHCDVSQPLGGAAGTCIGRWMPREAPGTGITSSSAGAASSSSQGSSAVVSGSSAGSSASNPASSASGVSTGESSSAGSSSSALDSSSLPGSSSGPVCSGCLNGTSCHVLPSAAACGINGGACVDCGSKGDTCRSDGTCGCGMGGRCGMGFVCRAGACVCDHQTCPTGCCGINGCEPGDRKQACGGAGLACETCTGNNQCTGGICTQCTPGSCPDGCCSGASCVTPTALACGTAGLLCQVCDPVAADGCQNGVCGCGGQAACVLPQVCRSGSCQNP